MDTRGDVTDLIHRAQGGDAAAASELLEITYEDLHRLAHRRMSSVRHDDLLGTTVLVNEWFIRFSKSHGVLLEDRAHFMRYAAVAMRSIIVDSARRRLADRRGAGAQHVALQDGEDRPAEDVALEEILGVHGALERLSALDDRMCSVVEMRYFGGMTEEEIAESLEISARTVRRTWNRARLWLADALA